MRALDLDFSRSRPPTLWWQWMLFFFAAALTASLFLAYRSYVNDIDRLEREIQLAQKDEAALRAKPAPKVDASTATAIRGANKVLARLHLPWETLFHDIELAQTDEVALLAIQPNAERFNVVIDGEARNSNAVLTYIGALEEQASLANVSLISHEIRRDDPEKPVRFSVTAQWVAH